MRWEFRVSDLWINFEGLATAALKVGININVLILRKELLPAVAYMCRLSVSVYYSGSRCLPTLLMKSSRGHSEERSVYFFSFDFNI